MLKHEKKSGYIKETSPQSIQVDHTSQVQNLEGAEMSMTRDGMTRSKRFLRLVAATIVMLACPGPLSAVSADEGACIQLRGQKIRWIIPNAVGGAMTPIPV